MAGYCDNFSMIDGDSSNFSMIDGGDEFKAFPGLKGDDGTTFYPHVSAEGILSWTNDGGKPNPDPVNIKGTDGTSAYQAAVEAGFSGTEAEFNTYLSGIGNLTDLVDRKAGALVDTASGSIASFVPDSTIDNLLGVSVAVEPVQDLHGYDSPWPAGGGKNKLKITAKSTTINGITYTVNADGTIVANGTASDDSTFVLTNGTGIFNFDSEMILNGSVSGFEGNVRTRFGVTNPGIVYDDFGNGVTIPQISDISTRYTYVQITIANGTTVNNIVFKPMIRLASVSDATFAPYSNICPITGFTGCNVTRTGKNLCPPDGWAQGQLQADGLMNVVSYAVSSPYILLTGGQTYTLSRNYPDYDAGQMAYHTYDLSKTHLSDSGWKQNNYAFTPESDCYIRITTRAKPLDQDPPALTPNDVGTMFVVQLELGSTATAYEPYSGDTYSITFPSEAGTVYGGTLDAVNGVLTVDRAMFTWTSTSGGYVSTTKAFCLIKSDVIKIDPTNQETFIGAICDKLKSETWAAIATNPNEYSAGCVYGNGLAFRIPGFTTASEYTAWLADNPLTFVYLLNTPVVIQLDPVTISTISGQTNNVWSDAGDVDVTYAADIKAYIDRLNQPTEDDMIANSLIASGKYFTVNNRLFISTASIAAGAQIIPGTNCTETSLAAALNALNT